MEIFDKQRVLKYVRLPILDVNEDKSTSDFFTRCLENITSTMGDYKIIHSKTFCTNALNNIGSKLPVYINYIKVNPVIMFISVNDISTPLLLLLDYNNDNKLICGYAVLDNKYSGYRVIKMIGYTKGYSNRILNDIANGINKALNDFIKGK